jgi:hypothetical protein
VGKDINFSKFLKIEKPYIIEWILIFINIEKSG